MGNKEEVLQSELTGARFAAKNHLATVNAQKTIIESQQRELAAKEEECKRLASNLTRATDALNRAGFQDLGGELWKPPLGPQPRFIEVAAPAKPEPAVQRFHWSKAGMVLDSHGYYMHAELLVAPVAQPLAPSGAVLDFRKLKFYDHSSVPTDDILGHCSQMHEIVGPAGYVKWEDVQALAAQPLAGQDVRAVVWGTKRKDGSGYGQVLHPTKLQAIAHREANPKGNQYSIVGFAEVAAPSPVNPKQEQVGDDNV